LKRQKLQIELESVKRLRFCKQNSVSVTGPSPNAGQQIGSNKFPNSENFKRSNIMQNTQTKSHNGAHWEE